MAGVSTLKDLFVRELRDLLYAEKRLVRELPKMARAATDDDLKASFQEHAEQTREHVARLERIFEIIGQPARAERCEGIEGLLKEAETMQEEAEGPAVRDAAMIAAAQRVEHYEIAAYGCARAFASQLKLDEAVQFLDQTIAEEGAADKALSGIAERRVNPEAATAAPMASEGRSVRMRTNAGQRNGTRSSRRASGGSRRGPSRRDRPENARTTRAGR